MKLILKELMDQGIHLGHNKYKREMSVYLLGFKGKRSIIDLEETLLNLSRTSKLIKNIIEQKGDILIISKNNYFSKQIKYTFTKIKQPYITIRWIGGILTNFYQIRKGMKNIKINKYKYKSSYQGIINMHSKPTLCIILNTNENATAINEAKLSDIPLVAILDSDSSPNGITYRIPGNDDSIESLSLYTNVVENSIKIGKTKKVINFFK